MSTLDTRKLDKLLRALTENPKRARVGVLGANNVRAESESEKTNAQIGLDHEFGLNGQTKRSWLRAPIIENFAQEAKKAGAFDEETFKKVLASGTLDPWLAKFGLLAEAIVAEAFATGGFGKWKPSNMKFKKNHQTLVETGQLRTSIISEVK